MARLHQRPRGREVEACRPWVLAEIDRVRPTVLVTLGATAAGALFGRTVGGVMAMHYRRNSFAPRS